jgi:3-oxoacyl-[acyl-carrier protein] reductase
MGDNPKSLPEISEMSVIITGATRGIGAGIASMLASRGVRLTLSYLSKDKEANALREQLEKYRAQVVLFKGDISNPQTAKALIETASEKYGRVDALVGNLGPFLWREIADTSVDEWNQIIGANLSAQFYLVRELIHGMRERGFGNFIFIGGVGSGQITGHPRASAYNTAKVALAEFMRTLAIEEGPNGIRANIIAPGIIDNGEYTEGFKERIVNEIPLRYVGQPEDIANAVIWLLSPESRYVNGAMIDVSGGYHLTIR